MGNGEIQGVAATAGAGAIHPSLTTKEKQNLDVVMKIFSPFREATDVLGSKSAREIWKHCLKRPRGAPKGSRNTDLDQELLTLHDVLASNKDDKARKAVPRLLADRLHAAFPGKHGQSADATQKKIRRLLGQRSADSNSGVRVDVDKK